MSSLRFRSGLRRTSAAKVAPAFVAFRRTLRGFKSLSQFSRAVPSVPKSVAFLTPILSLFDFSCSPVHSGRSVLEVFYADPRASGIATLT